MNDEMLMIFKQQLLTYIKRKISNHDDAEDILADVLLKYVSRSQLPENPIAWLYTVSKHTIVDYYRSQKKFNELPNDLANEEVDSNEFLQLSKCILPMIEFLEKGDKEVIQLVDIDNLKQQQVADRLSISLPALKSRLLRARKKLQLQISKCCAPIRNKKGVIEAFSEPEKVCNNC